MFGRRPDRMLSTVTVERVAAIRDSTAQRQVIRRRDRCRVAPRRERLAPHRAVQQTES
jgi:hypothetical protein